MNCPHCGKKIEILVKIVGSENPPKRIYSITPNACWCSLTAFNGGLGKTFTDINEFIEAWKERPRSQKYLEIFTVNEAYFRNEVSKIFVKKSNNKGAFGQSPSIA
jgi:hypothetical protein